MKRILLSPGAVDFPSVLQPLTEGAAVYDSSCSPNARVYFIDRDGGYFAKRAAPGSLSREAAMTRLFHEKGMAAEVLHYESADHDWLLTRRVPGEDCTHAQYLAKPKRLAITLGERLRALHETATEGQQIPDHTGAYIRQALDNYYARRWDESRFPDNWGYASAEDAWAVLQELAPHFRQDVLLHGDYCLPNVMLEDWRFTGFIDVGAGGMGDRHIDLFWGVWSLGFNLKTDKWGDTFLDAYGRDRVQPEMLRAVAAAEVFL